MCLGSGLLKTNVIGMEIRACTGCQVCFSSVLQVNSFLRCLEHELGWVLWGGEPRKSASGRVSNRLKSWQHRKGRFHAPERSRMEGQWALSSCTWRLDWLRPSEHQFVRTHASSWFAEFSALSRATHSLRNISKNWREIMMTPWSIFLSLGKHFGPRTASGPLVVVFWSNGYTGGKSKYYTLPPWIWDQF